MAERMTLKSLDRRTLESVVGRIGLQLAELERRAGHCALCRSSELRRLLDQLRTLLKESSSAPEA